MFPFCFEWQWNADHYLFLGLLYVALTIVGCGLIYSGVKTWLDLPQADKHSDSPPEISYRSRYSVY